MLKRQGMRAAFGGIAAVFAVGVLVLCNVAGWQVLRWYVQPIYATLVLLGINSVRGLGSTVLAQLCGARGTQNTTTGDPGSTQLSRPDHAGPFGRNCAPFPARDEFAPVAALATANGIATMVARKEGNRGRSFGRRAHRGPDG